MLQRNALFLFQLFCSMLQLLVTANVPSSLILVTLMMEAIRSSESSVHKGHMASRPKHGILHSHNREKLKSYVDENSGFINIFFKISNFLCSVILC
jgi:hypothetical protein